MVKAEPKGTLFRIKRFSLHDGPGIRTTIFLKGCPLNCVWCHSPEGIDPDITIWHNKNLCIACGKCVGACPEEALEMDTLSGNNITINRTSCRLSGMCVDVCPTMAIEYNGFVTNVTDVMLEIEKDTHYYKSSGGGVTLSGGEPFFQPDFAREILKECHTRSIHTAVETSLFCKNEIIADLMKYIDLFIIDLKLFDPGQHLRHTGRSNTGIRKNFRFLMKSRKSITVRIPLIRNITDKHENIIRLSDYVNSFQRPVTIEYIDSNPLAENNYKRLGIPYLL